MLACASGDTNTAVAQRFCVRGSTVGKWRQRYLDVGLEGLHDELRPGRPHTYQDDKVAEVINRALQTKPRWQHPLECPFTGRRDRNLQNHRSPLAAALLSTAAPEEALQVVNGSLLC